MSRSTKPESTMLPTFIKPVPDSKSTEDKESQPVVQASSAHRLRDAQARRPLDLESAEEARDCYFKVIDTHLDDKRIETQGECYRREAYADLSAKVPSQRENTIRVILDGRYSSNGQVRYPGGHLYSIEPDIDKWRYLHIPTLRRMWDENVQAGWCSVTCLARHTYDCTHYPKENQSYDGWRYESSKESSVCERQCQRL
jgi:hypothetical protein